MPKPIDPSQYPALIQAVNETYTDQIEAVRSAQVNDDNETITLVGVDGQKQIAVNLGKDVTILLMDATPPAKFAAATPGKKKNCKPGSLSCGNACLSMYTASGKKKTCRKPATPGQQAVVAQVVAATNAGAPAAKTPAATPPAATPPPAAPAAQPSAFDRIKAIHDFTLGDEAPMTKMELDLIANQLKKLEALPNPTPAQREHIAALLTRPDKFTSEAAMDRVDSLKRYHDRLMNGQPLRDQDFDEWPDMFAQGMRGGSNQAMANTAALYSAEIYNKLDEAGKQKFVDTWAKNRADSIQENLGFTQNNFDAAMKLPEFKAFVDEVDGKLSQQYGYKVPAAAKPATAPGGGLATVPKPEEPKKKVPINEQVDRQFANTNPTDQDVDGWVQARVKAHFEPTPENLSQRAAKELKFWLKNNFEYNLGLKDPDQFSKRVVDRESYALAQRAAEEWRKKKDPAAVKRLTDPQTWIESRMARFDGLKPSDIPKLEQKIATTKSDAVRKKAQKDLDSLRADEARRPAVEAQAQADAARYAAIYSAKKEDRLNQLRQQFDDEVDKIRPKMERDWAKIQKGNKKTLQEAKEDAVGLEVGRQENPQKPGTFLPLTNDEIKSHLSKLAEKFAGDMFSGKTKAEVRSEYRALAAKYHPDNQDTGDANEFKKITAAYNTKIQEFD